MTTDHTPIRKLRVSDPLWEAYGSVCDRVFSRNRSEDLVDHMRGVVREHGDEDERAKLDQAERELAERRARKGGRPRKE
ncbi:hypothetical protein [Actinomadura fibrosa]|uniref:CopG family transcriptional regulator n=1 Tax=Actinomadura fibrosa TaxID=111802 RepID=A0ABW2XKG1_9ACTN|nr:hypothetical protein [Actinomadura fibrosa]